MKRRKTNKGKQVSRGCSNHGSCSYCYANRTHSNRKRLPADENEQINLTIDEKYGKI